MKEKSIIRLGQAEQWEKDKVAVFLESQGDVETHAHSFFELAYITGGTAIHTLNGVTENAKEGDYFLVDYGGVHSYTCSRNFTLINCLFYPEIIDETLIGCRSAENLLQICLIRYYRQYRGQSIANRTFHDSDGTIKNLLMELHREFREKKMGYEEMFRCKLLEILIQIMRNNFTENCVDFFQNTDKSVVGELIAYINKHYKGKALLNRFCREHHYSVPYISRVFRQETGTPASEYLRRIRMQKACELLTGSDLQVQEIARSCGYEDMAHFRKIFSEMFHMSPREYKKYKK